MGKVIYPLKRELSSAEVACKLAEVAALPVILMSMQDAHVDAAADLKSSLRFSYADAFATALAVAMNAPLVTGDREFLAIQSRGVVELEWLGA